MWTLISHASDIRELLIFTHKETNYPSSNSPFSPSYPNITCIVPSLLILLTLLPLGINTKKERTNQCKIQKYFIFLGFEDGFQKDINSHLLGDWKPYQCKLNLASPGELQLNELRTIERWACSFDEWSIESHSPTFDLFEN